MNPEELEEQFDLALRESLKLTSSLIPDAGTSWLHIQKKLKKIQKRKKGRKIFKLLSYAAVSFLIGALLFGTPVISQPITQFASDIKQEIMELFFGSPVQNGKSEPKTAPPPENKINVIPHKSKSNPEQTETNLLL